MATLETEIPRDVEIVPGTTPEPDRTGLAAVNFVETNKVRFYDGFLETVGGCEAINFDNGIVIDGSPRAMYSLSIGTNKWLSIGTNTTLYVLLGSSITNITPLVDSADGTTLSTDPLETDYNALSSDPVTTVDTSTTVTIALTAHRYEAGDVIVISGVGGTVNGVPAGELNATHIVRSTPTANSFTIIVGTAATSSGSGGGASVVSKSGVVRVTDTAHALDEGERIALSGATDTAGILAAAINKQHIIRNVTTNTYDIVTSGTPTSSASGGGASVLRQEQVADGEADAFYGRGFGLGKFGTGRFGVSKSSSVVVLQPRIYSFDRYGNNIVLTPGDQKGVYEWTGDTGTAPAAISGAPEAVEYLYVSDNIIVTLGADGVPNRLKWCDQGNKTVWTATAQNQAGEDDIEGANKWISHINVNGVNLLFCEDQLWLKRYVGRPNVWRIRQVVGAQGIIARPARVQLNGIAYWMGLDDFYMFNGGSVLPIPGNGPNGLNTVRRYIFKNLNRQQQGKCFMWVNTLFNEIWAHFPTGDSLEPNEYVIINLSDYSWTLGEWERSAAEYPFKAFEFPRLADDLGVVYKHEFGLNDNGAALNPRALTNWRRNSNGRTSVILHGIIPDAIQEGNFKLRVRGKDYPKTPDSRITTLGPFTVEPDTEKVDFQIETKLYQYEIFQDAIDQYLRAGAFQELVARGSLN